MTNNGTAQKTVTPASQWRQGEILELPSGNVAEVKRPSAISMMLEDGTIPDSFIGIVSGNINGQPQASEQQGYSREDIKAILDLTVKICRAAFVKPRIVPPNQEADYTNDEISIDDVSEADRMFVMNWAFGSEVAANAAKFRSE